MKQWGIKNPLKLFTQMVDNKHRKKRKEVVGKDK